MHPPNEITQLLWRWNRGDRDALDQLKIIVDGDLYKLAHSYLRQERPGHMLQPTARVNEACLRLIKQDFPEWQSRRHCYCMAAQLMRQILVEYARTRAADKRGGGAHKFSLDEAVTLSDEKAAEIVALDDALVALARIIELRHFGGLSLQETAAALDISVAAIGHEMRLARVAAPRNGARFR
jgi:RNA polymerase sigma-70 factor (ECF subfamily)